MRRAQFELMGLAIAVVIITVGIFFILSLSLGDEGEDITGVFVEEQFSQNVIDALMKTSVDGCPSYTTADVLYWYVAGNNVPNSGASGTRCELIVEDINAGATDFEDLATNLAWLETEVLDPVIQGYRGRAYRLQLRKNCEQSDVWGERDNCETVNLGNECEPQAQQTGRPGKQSVSLYPLNDRLELVLWICSPRRA